MNALDNFLDYMHRNRKTFQLLLGLVIALIVTVKELKAQNTAGFMYGKVYTDGNVYLGQIRWGREEAYWNDHFNTAKIDNSYEDYKSKEKSKDSYFDWRLLSIWDDKTNTTNHIFSCQFGDIKEIINYGNERLIAKFKNGEKIKLSGNGYNDASSKILVLDDELGEINVSWKNINRVEFLPTPENLSNNMGKPIFGTVETMRKGKFTGFIQWDHDERIGTDKLDGDTRDGTVAIAFDKIKAIESRGNSSFVRLKSGREYNVSNTNDVNSQNKGIIVSIDGVGKIDIPWKAFKSVVFEDVDHSGSSYASFNSPKRLNGSVIQYNDNEVRGEIVFDLDEVLDLELLEGKDDEIQYKIPFRNIKSIEPKNYNYSTVTLRNGDELLLGNGRDVTDDNAGLLVISNNSNKPEYIQWTKIVKIVFE
jgi:hypothetical protein